jgi:phospholipid/cholesterol/gamma-HCH transport system permease protein
MKVSSRTEVSFDDVRSRGVNSGYPLERGEKLERTGDAQLYGLEMLPGPGGGIVLALRGRIDHHNVTDLLAAGTAALEESRPRELTVDLDAVDFLDSAGALAVLQLRGWAERRGIPVQLANLREAEKGIIELIDPQALLREPLIGERRTRGFVVRLGEATLRLARELFDTVSFVGQLAAATVLSLLRPRRIRWSDVRNHIQSVGVDGLPIIGLLSFLMGYIIGAMAVSTLQLISLNFLIGRIVAIGIIQEFGPIVVAVMVAGRSGSAFAAELATMEVNEEIDAITAMGYEPVYFLGVPRVLAMIVAVPLVTLYSDLIGMLGGLVVAATKLEVSAYEYFREIPPALSVFSFTVSTLKTFVFAFIIVAIGCHRGFRARGGAEAVGTSTTSALVTSIFLVILADFTFALLVNYLG